MIYVLINSLYFDSLCLGGTNFFIPINHCTKNNLGKGKLENTKIYYLLNYVT